MFTNAKMQASATRSMTPYIVAGVLYYVLNFVVAYVMERFEKYFNYYR